MKTRIIEILADRRSAINDRTVAMSVVWAEPPPSFRSLFIRNYDAIRAIGDDLGRHWLAVIAIDEKGFVHGTMALAAKVGEINAAIVGRHGMADLYLDGDTSLSLRHLAVITHPRSQEGLRFRLLDLRTGSCFSDEDGRPMRGLVADGPVFVRCGNYSLFCLPSSICKSWPDSAEDAWKMLPERIYESARDRPPTERVQRRGQEKSHGCGNTTQIIALRGPSWARRRMTDRREDPLGELRIITPDGTSSIAVGPRAANDGVLVGRYERCDTRQLQTLCSFAISRVHLLVIQVEGVLHAVDTGSSNGTWIGDQRVHVAPLQFGSTLSLADGCAEIEWRVLH